MKCIGSVLHSGQVHHSILKSIVQRVLALQVLVDDAATAQEASIYRCYQPDYQTTIPCAMHRFLRHYANEPTGHDGGTISIDERTKSFIIRFFHSIFQRLNQKFLCELDFDFMRSSKFGNRFCKAIGTASFHNASSWLMAF